MKDLRNEVQRSFYFFWIALTLARINFLKRKDQTLCDKGRQRGTYHVRLLFRDSQSSSEGE